MTFRKFFHLFGLTFNCWRHDNVSHLAAALSYYTIFSLAPVLVICISLAGLAFGEQEVLTHVLNQIGYALGNETALEIKMLLDNIHRPTTNIFTSILSGLILIWGTVGLFSELQYSFNAVWGVKPKDNRTWKDILRDRFFSFTIVLGVCFVLLVSLLFSSFLKATADNIHRIMPLTTDLWVILDFFISIGGITFLFALIFKVIPDVVLRWPDVMWGAFVTSLLFTFGKFLLEIYLVKSNIANLYGAAASLIVILVWVYYSAQILLFGAEFTKAYAKNYGSRVHVKSMAERV